MANKVMIVGTGNVGMSYAYALISRGTAVNELVLVDVNADDAEGEAMDLRDALPVGPVNMKINSGTYADAGDADMVVITAGAKQEEGETRMDLVKKNEKIFAGIVGEVMQSGFDGIFLVVSNPMDVMTYITWQHSRLPHERVIGSGTVLDSARLRYRLGGRLGVNGKSIHAYQVGEHGDSEFALWSSATMGGQKITELLDDEALSEVEDYARKAAYEIIAKKGSTYYGIGMCLALITQCIFNDEKRVLPVSSWDEMSGTYNGWPAVVGRGGIVRRVGLELTDSEREKMAKSVAVLREAIDSVE